MATIIPNGIELEHYQSRGQYGFDSDTNEFKVVQIGRLVPEHKGQGVAVNAFKLLTMRHPGKNMRLYFVGGGDGMNELQKLVAECDLQDKVVFEGQVDRNWVKTRLQYFHLLIQPSYREGFGLTVVEGFACGLPVVASDLDGPKEIMEYLNAGLKAVSGDAADLATQMEKAYAAWLSGDLEHTNYMVQDKSRLARFDIENTARNYIEQYSRFKHSR